MSNCLFCGKDCNKNYCDNVCYGNSVKSINQLKIKQQLINGENIPHVNMRSIKLAISEMLGYKCSICGKTKWMNQPIPLVIDHIDGHSSNNTLNNLRLVCGNCDMQLPTYKSKNKSSDRTNRKKYY